jgi:NAD(P)-dependent dehydrogenase (short-subunit alcohol dehydrogenase family)
MTKTLLITGSSGLIGSEVCAIIHPRPARGAPWRIGCATGFHRLKALACRTLELADKKTLSIVTAKSYTAGKLSAR